MPDGHIGIKVTEAIEGEGPDGETGPVASGNEFHLRVSPEVAIGMAFELAIAGGFMEDHEKPKIADLSEMRRIIEAQRKAKEQ